MQFKDCSRQGFNLVESSQVWLIKPVNCGRCKYQSTTFLTECDAYSVAGASQCYPIDSRCYGAINTKCYPYDMWVSDLSDATIGYTFNLNSGVFNGPAVRKASYVFTARCVPEIKYIKTIY